MIRAAAVVCRKDLRIEWRSRVTVTQVVPFVLTVVMLFAFALDGNSPVLGAAAPGLFWVTVLFAANLVSGRAAALDRADGLRDALALSGIAPAALIVGRSWSIFVQLSVIEVVLAAAMLLTYDVEVSGVGLVLTAIPLGTYAIATVGAAYGALASGGGGRDALLPLLTLPVLAPVLLAGTNAMRVAFGSAVGPGWRWVVMLGMLSGIYVGAAVAAAPAILEDS
ncbi:MAG: heme exporter protein CcmB [Microthrixaceae bacterium]